MMINCKEKGLHMHVHSVTVNYMYSQNISSRKNRAPFIVFFFSMQENSIQEAYKRQFVFSVFLLCLSLHLLIIYSIKSLS